MSQDNSDRFFESDNVFLKVGQRPVTRAAEEKTLPQVQVQPCEHTHAHTDTHIYIYVYIYIYIYIHIYI